MWPLPALLAAVALLAAWQMGPGAAAAVLLLIAGLGLGSAQGGFWAIPTQLLAPAAFSVAVVGINILGSAGGLVMPQLMGIARETQRRIRRADAAGRGRAACCRAAGGGDPLACIAARSPR